MTHPEQFRSQNMDESKDSHLPQKLCHKEETSQSLKSAIYLFSLNFKITSYQCAIFIIPEAQLLEQEVSRELGEFESV